MENYRQMYAVLFNRITDAIAILQTAQAEAEEIFMAQEEPRIIVLENSNNET